jgi:16S rRNA (cytosine1402-N4)-methyltransferase
MHIPVLFTESINALNIQPDGVYVDGTLGGAGHAYAIGQKLSQQGTLIGFDVDADAIERAKTRLSDLNCKTQLFHRNFRDIAQALSDANISPINGIFLDLGYSSYQIDNPQHGLSFQHDGPLDMNLGHGDITAADIINTWSEETLADIFYGYGDETAAKLIAKKLSHTANMKSLPVRQGLRILLDIVSHFAKVARIRQHECFKHFVLR